MFIHTINKSVILNKHFAKISHIEIRIPTSTFKGMEDQLKNINPSKPPGPDDIFQQILKNIIASINAPLAKLVNISIASKQYMDIIKYYTSV